MKPFSSRYFDGTTILFIILLIAAGCALLAGSHFGVLSLDRIQKFWPTTLIAAGLVQLLTWRNGQES